MSKVIRSNDELNALANGKELVVNGTNLVSTAGWDSMHSVVSVANGGLVVDDTINAGTNSSAVQTIKTTVGVAYEIKCTVVSETQTAYVYCYSNGWQEFVAGDVYYLSGVPAGSYRGTFVATTTETTIALATGGTGIAVFNNISVKEMPKVQGENLPDYVATRSNYGFKNYIINGGFDVWQRGTSFSSDGYTADRFTVATFSGSVVKNGAASGPQGFPNYLSVDKTAGQDTVITQRWEMPVNKCKTFLNGRTLTFSAWILTSVPIEQVYFIKNGGAANSYAVKSFSITKSPTLNTWSKIEATISNINFAYENGSYIEIRMDPANAEAGTIHTTGWQVEEGSIATSFEHRPYGLELSLCQRYFRQVAYKWFGTAENLYIYGSSVPFGVEMRVSPTVVYSSAYGDQNGFNTPSITLTTSKSCVVVATATASGSNKQFGAIFNASAEL